MKLIDTKLKLLNGVEIPIIGLGTYKMNDKKETYNAVLTALKNGYRHIDTAQYYQNEVIIGQAIKDSGIPRSEIFITSKIWNANHKYEEALQQVDEILNRLGVEYLDLCLVHWPTTERNECYRALETAYKAKKLRAIGVSNFEVSHLEELMQISEIQPMVNQIELHPGLNNSAVVEFCRQRNIVVESWATMMQGQCASNPTIIAIAEKHHKNPGQICLKWAVQQDIVIISKSVNPDRIIENTKLDDFMLDDSHMYALLTLPEKRLRPDPNNVNF